MHRIAWNRYKNRPKANLDQIITPIFGPDKTVTPERANLDQQENMIRRGRREEKTETKRDRKSIIAENPKPTKRYKNSGFRQLSRTLWLEHQKQSTFGKGGDINWFLGPTQNTQHLQWFRRSWPKTKTTNSMPGKGVPWKRPVFFFARRKVITRPFWNKPNFQRKSAFSEAPPTKEPYFYRGILGRA